LYLRCKALWSFFYEFEQVYLSRGSADLVVTDLFGSQPNVTGDAAGEKVRVLQNHAKAPSQVSNVKGANVNSTDANGPALHIIEAQQQARQGALAAGVIYYHGMALAADTLALDRVHRESPDMTRNFREGVWKMGEIAGSILRDIVRQRRSAFRQRRRQMVRSLPKSAYMRIQNLFGKKAATVQHDAP
jgi:hypothetical protein